MIGASTFALPPRLSLSGHAHDQPLLMLVSEGALDEAVGRQVHTLRAGSVRLSRAGAVHDLKFGDSGARCTLVNAAGPFWTRIFARALGQHEHSFVDISPECTAFLALAAGDDLLRSRAGLDTLGAVLAAVRYGGEQRRPSWLDDALDAFDRADQRRVTAIAGVIARDRTHFARAFAAHTGLRPTEYRAVRRIAAAFDALQSDAPLAEVALASGYAHQSHMNNAFRALLGRSPGSVRGV